MTESLLDDESLVKQIQQGNHQAFTMLVHKYSEKYYRLAYRYLANREQAEDVTQIAFIKLWEYPDNWNPKKKVKFSTWFYRVVVNLCLDQKKKDKQLGSVDDLLNIADENPDQEWQSQNNQMQDLLKKEIIALPSRQKTALILCFYEQFNHQQAADLMQISVKALESLLMRAKLKLKTQMQVYL